MATVTSFTKERIQELLSFIPGMNESLADIQLLVNDLRTRVEEAAEVVVQYREVVMPPLQEALDANDIAVADLRDNLIPNLDQALEANQASLLHLNEVILPGLRDDLDSGIENSLNRPQIYFTDVEPTDPDVNDRYLQIDDVWYDTANRYLRHRWTGTNWETFEPAISDLADQILANLSPEHTLFSARGGILTSFGTGVTAV